MQIDTSHFDYDEAFSRNIGWVTAAEQATLRGKRIAIAGLGGVGGIHLLTLARLGVGKFNLADFDTFALANFNRQIGATISNMDRPKIDVMIEMARDINPTLEIRAFREGVSAENLDDFLRDVDVYVDGLDYFAFPARRATYAACARLSVPAVIAAPLGMGVALLNFLPGRMSFEEYFRLEGQSEHEQALRLLVGLSPAMLQRSYLVDRSRANLHERRGPSTSMSCQLCAGFAATEALKIMLRRGRLWAAPWGLHFDPYRVKLARTWRPWGNRNPVQRITLAIARHQLAAAAVTPGRAQADSTYSRPIEQILDLARWAPSGDNTQPWRFEIRADDHVVVHGFDTRDHCVYDLDGHASQMALGAMLETLRVAATGHALRTVIDRRRDAPEIHPVFDVRLCADPSIRPSPLISSIRARSVHRRPMSTRPLTDRERSELDASVGSAHSVVWLAGWTNRMRMASLMSANGKLRLTLPEAYEVHRSIIDWDRRFSEDKVPYEAIGLDPVTTRLMRWVMGSWARVDFFNTWLGGTLIPRLELDMLPALGCAAHFAIVAATKPQTIDDFVDAGAAMQRFWLTATSLGLSVQPEMTPVIFARYVASATPFSRADWAQSRAARISSRLQALLAGREATEVAFLGRVAQSAPCRSRSIRLPLELLLHR